MRVEVAYADSCLDAWASWVRSSQGAWPPRTLLARIIEEGVSGAAQGITVERMPISVMQTDRAVAHLEPRLRKTTKIYYLTHASSEVKAAQLGVSRATFWRLVERAQVSVYYTLQGGLERETQTEYSQASLQKVSPHAR